MPYNKAQVYNAGFSGFSSGGSVDVTPVSAKSSVVSVAESALTNAVPAVPNFPKELQISRANDLENTLKFYGFTKDALNKIYRHLGAGDVEKGKNKFLELLNNRSIQIKVERIGVTKTGSPKFYLVINKREGRGVFNEFCIGFSPKGTPRAISKPRGDYAKQFENNLQQFREKVNAHKQDRRTQYLSRLMNVDDSVKVSELGEMNLEAFIKSTDVTPKTLLQVFKRVSQGISLLHSLDLVHRDLSQQNIVVVSAENKKGKKVQPKIIDWDLIWDLNGFEGQQDGGWQGSASRLAPEITDGYHQGSDGIFMFDSSVSSPAQDIWAMMCIMCEADQEMRKQGKEGLLSDEFIQRHQLYTREDDYEKRREFLQGKTNLFEGLEPRTPLDRLVYRMASKSPEERITTDMLVQELKVLIAEIE